MKFFNKRSTYKKNVSENNHRFMIMFFLVGLILLPGALMISTSIQASHQGSQLSDLDSEIVSLKQEIRQIQSEIVSTTSLSEISESAEELGFAPPEHLVYIQKNNPVAQLQ